MVQHTHRHTLESATLLFTLYSAFTTFLTIPVTIKILHQYFLKYRVPQFSIVVTLIFPIYVLPLGQDIHSHIIHFHWYDDDTLLYLPVMPEGPCQITKSPAMHLLNVLQGFRCQLAAGKGLHPLE